MTLPESPRAIITGAGSGLGRALSVELASRGAHLVLTDVDRPSVEDTAHAAELAGAGSTRVAACDVTRVDALEELAASVTEPVDLVVNNAGVSCGGRIGEIPVADWRWSIDVNLFGVIHGCHVFVPRLRAQGRGHVLNVASAAGLISLPRLGPYSVAKAGVVALSETLAAELAGTQVGVTVLCPTFVRTNIAKEGRFADDASRSSAQGLVARGATAGTVARAALASVDGNELYSIPMADGLWLWRLKRASPAAFQMLAKGLARLS